MRLLAFTGGPAAMGTAHLLYLAAVVLRSAATNASLSVQVVTYNLYWWCVSDEYGTCPQYANGKGFQLLYERIRENGPFDLIGFQECDDVGKIVAGASLASSFRYFVPPQGLGTGKESTKCNLQFVALHYSCSIYVVYIIYIYIFTVYQQYHLASI